MELRHIVLAFALVVFGIAMSMNASAANTDPVSPSTLEAGQTSTFDVNNYGQQSVEAEAGNITGLVVYSLGQTKAWQGYYGNITGTVTLDDANNFTFYNWSAAEPQGRIYATLNNSIAWDTVDCFVFDAAGPDANWNTIEAYYGIETDDVDGVNETYYRADHPSFEVGYRTITGCPTTSVFQNDTNQSENFVNVLLYDNTIPETGWIYTTLIENMTQGTLAPDESLLCYNGQDCDFQILVNENGHGTDMVSTTYFFWVELN